MVSKAIKQGLAMTLPWIICSRKTLKIPACQPATGFQTFFCQKNHKGRYCKSFIPTMCVRVLFICLKGKALHASHLQVFMTFLFTLFILKHTKPSTGPTFFLPSIKSSHCRDLHSEKRQFSGDHFETRSVKCHQSITHHRQHGTGLVHHTTCSRFSVL